MPFKVRGNSYYKLKKIGELVVKFADNDDERLVMSAKKQSGFKSSYFKAPEVHEITSSSFTMDYIYGYSFTEFLTNSTKNDLDWFIKKLDGYFKERIISDVDILTNVIKNKLKTIPQADDFLKKIDDDKLITVKAGICHGDFTFSNMVFNDEIYLIDFLPSYIESPTIDLLKLKQDTYHFWSLNMIEKGNDDVKIKISLRYIDNWINDNYKIDNYELLQCVNLFRIYPYAKTESIEKFLNDNIKKLCEHL